MFQYQGNRIMDARKNRLGGEGLLIQGVWLQNLEDTIK